jgi:hypothetical protein
VILDLRHISSQGKEQTQPERIEEKKKQKQTRITVEVMCTFRELQQKLEKW